MLEAANAEILMTTDQPRINVRTAPASPALPPLRIGSFTLNSRLVVGTGKYRDYATMQAAIEASGADCVTVAVRRERLVDAEGRSILDFLPLERLTILPNTAG